MSISNWIYREAITGDVSTPATMDHPPPSPPPEGVAVASETTGKRSPCLLYLINLDISLSRNLHSFTKPFLPHSLFLILELSADFRFFFPVALSLLLAPSSLSEFYLRPFLIPLLLGSLLDLALVGLIKILVRRSRPIYNHHASMSVAVSPDHYSFPSGHASRVFFIASLFYLSTSAIGQTVKELRYRNSFVESWIGTNEGELAEFLVLIVLVWAVVTSISRVFLGRHFVFDVLVGACLGMAEALFAFRFLRF